MNQVVAWNMAALRKAAGLTQAELGERIGWSYTTVSAAERSWDGKRIREFDADQLAAIAGILGVPLLALFLPPPEGKPSPGMAELLRRVLPESATDSPAMDAYRERLADAARLYLDPVEAGDLLAYLRDMTDPAKRHAMASQRVSDLRAFEREYKRGLRAYLEGQLAELGPPEEDSQP